MGTTCMHCGIHIFLIFHDRLRHYAKSVTKSTAWTSACSPRGPGCPSQRARYGGETARVVHGPGGSGGIHPERFRRCRFLPARTGGLCGQEEDPRQLLVLWCRHRRVGRGGPPGGRTSGPFLGPEAANARRLPMGVVPAGHAALRGGTSSPTDPWLVGQRGVSARVVVAHAPA